LKCFNLKKNQLVEQEIHAPDAPPAVEDAPSVDDQIAVDAPPAVDVPPAVVAPPTVDAPPAVEAPPDGRLTRRECPIRRGRPTLRASYWKWKKTQLIF
jgi:hypothetical protein